MSSSKTLYALLRAGLVLVQPRKNGPDITVKKLVIFLSLYIIKHSIAEWSFKVIL